MKKKYTLLYYILTCLALVIIAVAALDCTSDRHRYKIGVSQCSEDAWRDKLNSELRMMGYINDSIDVTIKTAKDNSQTQIKQIDSLVQMGADLLVVSPNQVEAVTPAVEKAYKKGIPVILYDRKIKSNCYTAFIGSNNFQMGYDLGKYIANKLGGKGKIAEIMGLKDSSPSIERYRGFESALKEFPGIKITSKVFGNWEQESGEKAMDKILKGKEMPDYVFAHNDRMAYGAYLSAKKRHMEKQIKFVGIDGLTGKHQGIDLVCDGILDASYLNPTSGDEVIKLALKIINKEKYDKNNNLATTIITKGNAELTRMAAQNADRQRGILENLHNQVDKYEDSYEVQTLFLWLLGIFLFFVIIGSVFIYISYITKNKLSIQLTKKNNELERLNEEVIELTQSRLAFFTNVSHELRTPLTLIIDPLEKIMADKTISKPTMSLLRIVQRSAMTLKQLVDDIMNFRKIQNGKMQLKLTSFDIEAKTRLWVDDFYPSAEIRHISLIVNTEALTHKEIIADESKIERIVFNLVSNALKYTQKGGTVTVTLSDAPGNRIVLSVSDNGKGISEEEQKKVFDRFYQAHNSTGGTGIGLAVVKAYAELHNGKACVTSQLGKGSDFRIELPCSQDSVTDVITTGASKEATANQTQGTIPHEKETASGSIKENDKKEDESREKPALLVIDDNKDIRDYICETFKGEYSIIEAGNGKEGLDIALQYVPDIVVCDIMMPVMDGIEFCSALKTNTAICHIPVILLTAKTLDEQIIEGYEHGADSYITKPFSSNVLRARMESLLKNRKILEDIFKSELSNNTATTANTPDTKAGSADSNTPIDDKSRSIDKEFISKLLSIIKENMQKTEFRVEDIGSEIGLSRVQLYRKVKAITGSSVVDLLRKARLQQAKMLLVDSDKSVSEIAYEVGFSSPSYFTKCFKDEYGVLPGDARNG